MKLTGQRKARLADADAYTICAEVAETQDAAAVRHHNDLHVAGRPIVLHAHTRGVLNTIIWC